uniref:Chromogranin A n=1 Tax=Mola mola TaxID=94237 RepID=A0A3Q3XBU0_MOLML
MERAHLSVRQPIVLIHVLFYPFCSLSLSLSLSLCLQVMKCIVEALADVLSRPHLSSVSQECLVTLKTDDRLVTLLRHHNFLRELQEIALQGEPALTPCVWVPSLLFKKEENKPCSSSFISPGAGENRDDHNRHKSKEKMFDEEGEEEKRSALFPHKQEEKHENDEDEEETKRASEESPVRWSKRGKASPLKKKKKAFGKDERLLNSQEAPHHSKEASEEEEEEKKRGSQKSPEEKELQMIARRRHEEKRGSEEEGSQGIESLATIESELENAAQKLHELRQG